MSEDPDTECFCEQVVDPADPDDDYHYARICEACGKPWLALHCPHDGVQTPCINCGVTPRLPSFKFLPFGLVSYRKFYDDGGGE